MQMKVAWDSRNVAHKDPIEIIKLKEIYETFDGALDRCADVADVVEDVALKYGNGWVGIMDNTKCTLHIEEQIKIKVKLVQVSDPIGAPVNINYFYQHKIKCK